MFCVIEDDKPTSNQMKPADVNNEDSVIVDVDRKNVTETATPTTTTTTTTRSTHVVTFDKALQSVVVVFLVLFYYFVCDYLHFFPRAERTYNRDLFIFLLVILVLVNVVYTSTSSTDMESAKLLNREQTEEWKGWMQIMFVWYHYFRATETYNAIRIFIACYVWMTGFGNFFCLFIQSLTTLEQSYRISCLYVCFYNLV